MSGSSPLADAVTRSTGTGEEEILTGELRRIRRNPFDELLRGRTEVEPEEEAAS